MSIEFLDGKRAVVHEELQVEPVDVGARVALARRVEHHLVDGPPERNIGVLDHLNEGLPLDRSRLDRRS